MQVSFEPSSELRDRFERILDLAPLPGSSPNALQRLRDALDHLGSEVELHDLIDPLSKDPALSARVISLANSAFFARAVPVETIELAAARIGARRVRQLIFMQRVTEALLDGTVSPVMEQVWQRAIAVGYLSESIAAKVGRVDPDRAFASGLLHDLGTLIIADQAPELLKLMLEASHGVTLHQFFKRILGATPADVGHSAAHTHDFPSPIAEVMVGYANPRLSDPAMVQVVHVARALCGIEGRFALLAPDRTELAFDVCHTLGLSATALNEHKEAARHWIEVSRTLV